MLNSGLKFNINDFVNSLQNRYALFALETPVDIFINRHSFFVFAFVEQLICFVITDKRNNQIEKQNHEQGKSYNARNTNLCCLFGNSLILFCLYSTQFCLALTSSAFFLSFNTSGFFSFSLIVVPFLKTGVQLSDFVVNISESTNGMQFFDALFHGGIVSVLAKNTCQRFRINRILTCFFFSLRAMLDLFLRVLVVLYGLKQTSRFIELPSVQKSDGARINTVASFGFLQYFTIVYFLLRILEGLNL